MRKILIILAIIIAIPVSITAQEIMTPPISGVIIGSAMADESFSQWGGGLQVGTEISIDGEKGLTLRTLYTKWNFGDPKLEAIQTTAVLNWYAGRKWHFYTLMGADAWLNGDQSGADFLAGIGFSRQMYKASGAEWLVPFTTTMFSEISWSDVALPTGNVAQINVGFKFAKPVHR